jgi:hypothetical protein
MNDGRCRAVARERILVNIALQRISDRNRGPRGPIAVVARLCTGARTPLPTTR